MLLLRQLRISFTAGICSLGAFRVFRTGTIEVDDRISSALNCPAAVICTDCGFSISGARSCGGDTIDGAASLVDDPANATHSGPPDRTQGAGRRTRRPHEQAE